MVRYLINCLTFGQLAAGISVNTLITTLTQVLLPLFPRKRQRAPGPRPLQVTSPDFFSSAKRVRIHSRPTPGQSRSRSLRRNSPGWARMAASTLMRRSWRSPWGLELTSVLYPQIGQSPYQMSPHGRRMIAARGSQIAVQEVVILSSQCDAKHRAFHLELHSSVHRHS